MKTLTIALGVWAAVGPLAGIYLGHILSRSWQQKQWEMDNKRREYSELLSTLTKSYSTVVRLGGVGVVLGPDERRELSDAQSDALGVMRDRLFISKNPIMEKVILMWHTSSMFYGKEGDYGKFHESFSNLRALIISAAHKDLELSNKGYDVIK